MRTPVTSGIAHAGRLGGGQPLDVPVLRIFIALVICLMIAALAILFLRQRRGHDDLRRLLRGMPRPSHAIDVVEVRRLGIHAEIGVVRHRAREYLLVIQSGNVEVLETREITSASPSEDTGS